MNSLLAGYGDFNETVGAYASTDTRYDTYFAEGYLKLSAGSPITEADAGKVLISRALAEANGLQVGDSILLCEPEYTLKRSGEQRQAASVSVEIAGLFETSGDSTEMFSNWSMENSIDTADAMKARGYGLKGRTNFTLFRFRKRDGALLGVMGALAAVIFACFAVGGYDFFYYPYVAGLAWDTPSVLRYLPVIAFMAIPGIIEIKEKASWNYLKSKI